METKFLVDRDHRVQQKARRQNLALSILLLPKARGEVQIQYHLPCQFYYCTYRLSLEPTREELDQRHDHLLLRQLIALRSGIPKLRHVFRNCLRTR